MRNDIISLEKYFSIFADLSVVTGKVTIWAKTQCKNNSYIDFSPNCNQTTDRKSKIEKYLCKEVISFIIYFLADQGILYTEDVLL